MQRHCTLGRFPSFGDAYSLSQKKLTRDELCADDLLRVIMSNVK